MKLYRVEFKIEDLDNVRSQYFDVLTDKIGQALQYGVDRVVVNEDERITSYFVYEISKEVADPNV